MKCAVLLACALLAGCGREAPRKKVIVLGIDAMDPGFLERHWASLPNLDRLRHAGDFQRLATTIPPQSPVAWSTFITGLDPGGHGVFDFVRRDPQTHEALSSMAEIEPPRYALPIGPYLLPLSAGRVRRFLRGEAFWRLLDKAGVPVTLLRMPNNFPPLPSKSQTLSGMGTPDLRGTFGTFSYFTDDPLETARTVPGGRVVPAHVERDRAALGIEGPDNTLRKDHAISTVTMIVTRDATNPAALFEIEGQRLVQREGEWSSWVRVRFPIVPGLKSAAGMFRIYAKQLHPDFRIYVSPVNIDPFDPELPISTPASYSRELAEGIGPFYTQGIAEDTEALRAGVLTREEFHAQTRRVTDEQFRMLGYALDRFHGGVLFLHYLGVDQESHVSWGTHDDDLLAVYQRVDSEIGRVIAREPDATLLVISDHGFASFRRAVNLNTWLAREGFGAQVHGLGLNAIYVDAAGSERDRLAAEVAARLIELRDPLNGNHVVARVYRARDVYHGPAVDEAPDLIVGWADGYRTSWQSALGIAETAVIEDNNDEWQGDHCIAAELVPGVFLSNRKARADHLWLGDITVTILQEFGVRPAPAMRGRAVF